MNKSGQGRRRIVRDGEQNGQETPEYDSPEKKPFFAFQTILTSLRIPLEKQAAGIPAQFNPQPC
jgi:hypothetical protein